MRYLLLLAIALAVTITWQTSVVADNPVAETQACEAPAGQTNVKVVARAPNCR
jgi:hypothetical protein